MPGAQSTELVFSEDFHPDTIAALNELREIRLANLEQMLANLQKTAASLGAPEAELSNLKCDLQTRMAELKSRMENPRRIFADELELYMELLANPEA